MKMSQRGAIALAGLAGFAAGVAWEAVPTSWADVRETPVPEAFKSGSERSLDILSEMAGTLKRIEGRVERIEQTLARAAGRE